MGDRPAVSVVVPLYNKRDTIERCLKSIQAQTFKDFEVIVVDDGSTDGSASLVEPFLGERFRLISQENAGPAAARNRGVKEARAELIAFLDADDWWEPQLVEQLYRFLSDWPQAALVACQLLDSRTGKMALRRAPVLPRPATEGIVARYFNVARGGVIISSSSAMVRRAVFLEAGRFDERYRVGEDVDCWGRIALHHPVGFVEKGLAWYDRRVSTVAARRGLRNPFVDTGRAALAEGVAHDPEDLREYVDYLLYGQLKVLLVDGDRAEARRLLAHYAQRSRRYRLRFAGLSLCSMLPTPILRGPMEAWWRLRRLSRRALGRFASGKNR